ncbi:MAG TPA: universal stress protein [Thiotrichales bacterium]|nr:universal stress protein [Thiotrichales bacterium]
MSSYTHILAAIEFMPDSGQVSSRAALLARQNGAKLSLIHVVEPLPMDLAEDLVLPQDLDLETELVDNARSRLARIAEALDVDGPVDQFVELGPVRAEILRVAEEQQVDLIVVGSHGRHGIARLLGSTANAILHDAPCDVLSVRIKESLTS